MNPDNKKSELKASLDNIRNERKETVEIKIEAKQAARSLSKYYLHKDTTAL